MSVDTGKVAGRRKLRFESLDEILREAERLAAAKNVKQLGNWSLGQVLKHLASAMHMSIDGAKSSPPWFIRLIGPLLKKKVLKEMSAGFQLPKAAAEELIASPSTTTQDGIVSLRDAVQRMKSNSQRKPHSVFGKMTNAEWDQLHFRHAELHLSFIEPA